MSMQVTKKINKQGIRQFFSNQYIKLWHRRSLLSTISIYFILIIISYEFLYPLLRMISMAMMSKEDIINPTVDWIPKSLSFKNMLVAFRVLDVQKTLVNSMWYSGLLAFAQTFVSAMTGFAFARFNFKFKNFWFMMMLVSFVMPIPVVLIPRVMIFVTAQSALGFQFIGTPIPQFLLAIFGQGVYSTILILIFFRFFKMIPINLDEAAKIDGASQIQVFYHIAIRMSLTTILVVFLLSMVWNWNETYMTNTFLRNKISLLPVQLNRFDNLFASVAQGAGAHADEGEMRINEAYKMAATFITIAPLLILYSFVQKKFIEGIENTGITGE